MTSAENGLPRECGPHRIPQGPNEDIGQCPVCWGPTFAMRPENEQIGLHADDCSLPRRHEGYCVGGGEGHPVPEVVRGYWPGMDEDVAAARAKFGSVLPPEVPAPGEGGIPDHLWSPHCDEGCCL